MLELLEMKEKYGDERRDGEVTKSVPTIGY